MILTNISKLFPKAASKSNYGNVLVKTSRDDKIETFGIANIPNAVNESVSNKCQRT